MCEWLFVDRTTAVTSWYKLADFTVMLDNLECQCQHLLHGFLAAWSYFVKFIVLGYFRSLKTCTDDSVDKMVFDTQMIIMFFCNLCYVH